MNRIDLLNDLRNIDVKIRFDFSQVVITRSKQIYVQNKILLAKQIEPWEQFSFC